MLSLFKQYEVQKSYRTDWYPYYKEVIEQVKNDHEITDSTLEILWYSRDNGISSLRRGAPSKEEFEKAKSFLHELTLKIKANPNAQTYQDAYQSMLQAKEDGLLKKMYYALLNRVFAAVAPDKLTSTIDADSFLLVAKAFNERYQLNLVLNGDWFQNNVELKKAIDNFIPKDYDPLFVNMSIWYAYEDVKKGQFNAAQDSQAEDKIENEIAVNNLSPLNQIFYGPPGTGKTYHLQCKITDYTSQAEVLDRDVWLKTKLEPLNWMQVLTLCLFDIAGKAKVKPLVNHEYFQCKARLNNRDKNLSNTAWATLQTFTVVNSATVDYKSHSEPAIFDKTKDAEWFIVEQKRELVDDLLELAQEIKLGPQSAEVIKRFSATTFHQSYGYEEFIEGLKAKTDDEGKIHYFIESGVFLKLCQRAENDPKHRYAMFIDEINRGNISKIFGELITLIEVDKRAGCEHEMSVKLSYSGKDFSVPANVDIIGTMNSADRSLAMMDTALRRRFDFVEMMPDASQLKDATVKGINLTALLKTMNDRIKILYDREHTLGHAFFMPVKSLLDKGQEMDAFEALVSVFKNKIIPLLQEYFFEDWHKIRLVLGDNQRDDPLQFIKETLLSDRDLLGLFGKGFELNHFGDAPTQYKLKPFDEAVWQDKNAYLGIYSLAAI